MYENAKIQTEQDFNEALKRCVIMKLEKLNFMVHISLEWRSKLTLLEATVEFQKDFVK